MSEESLIEATTTVKRDRAMTSKTAQKICFDRLKRRWTNIAILATYKVDLHGKVWRVDWEAEKRKQ